MAKPFLSPDSHCLAHIMHTHCPRAGEEILVEKNVDDMHRSGHARWELRVKQKIHMAVSSLVQHIGFIFGHQR